MEMKKNHHPQPILMINLFFTGWNQSPKRYKSYFPTIEFIYDPLPTLQSNLIDEEHQTQFKAMTHSLGLVKALIYCSSCNIKSRPMIILAIDPPDISVHAIRVKLNQGIPQDLHAIYQLYIDLVEKNQIPPIPIHLYRNKKNEKYLDTDIYRSLTFYQSDTHYPYMVRSHRDQILQLYQNIEML
jgi:hypothetical protein